MDHLKIKERFLFSKEINISGIENDVPFIFESNSKETSAKLNEFLSENTSKVLGKIYQHGAVLLRGFKVSSETEFELAVTSIKQFNAMDSYFMSEDGRSLIDGCRYVHYTNKKLKTGGTLNLGGFHTENHYTCDVPAFISFWCRKPSLFGGETGLVHLGKVYEELNDSLKKKLNANTFFTSRILISEVAKRYNISEDKIKAECTDFGLEIIKDNDVEFVSIYKPAVINHPVNNTLSLVANLSGEIKGLDQALYNEFKSSFSGLKWKFHRVAWRRFPFLVLASQAPLKDVLFIGIPFLIKAKLFKNTKSQETTNANPAAPVSDRLGTVFTQSDVVDLAKSMRKNFTSFKWREGDILLIDNLQMAHTGMPGFGTRIIRALLANPVPLSYLSSSSGCQQPGNMLAHSSLSERMNYLKHLEQ